MFSTGSACTGMHCAVNKYWYVLCLCSVFIFTVYICTVSTYTVSMF